MSFISKRLEERRELMRDATGLEIIRNAVSTNLYVFCSVCLRRRRDQNIRRWLRHSL